MYVCMYIAASLGLGHLTLVCEYVWVCLCLMYVWYKYLQTNELHIPAMLDGTQAMERGEPRIGVLSQQVPTG